MYFSQYDVIQILRGSVIIFVFPTLYISYLEMLYSQHEFLHADRVNEEREWYRQRMEKKTIVRLWQVLSSSTDDSFRQIDFYSLRDVTIRRVTPDGVSRISHVTPSDNHIRVIQSTNIGDDNAHTTIAASSHFLVLNRTRAIFLPFPDEVKVHGVE